MNKKTALIFIIFLLTTGCMYQTFYGNNPKEKVNQTQKKPIETTTDAKAEGIPGL